ncbi:hypothetical protein CKO27_18125 [Thiocystis violacea]|nr:hypothetical protein [Thiocystis violacea]
MTARAESLGTLPGEISDLRGFEKSAEAVVAKKPGNVGGAKGRRKHEPIRTDGADHRAVI